MTTKKTSSSAWLPQAMVIMIIALTVATIDTNKGGQANKCGPLNTTFLLNAQDKQEARSDFLAVAQRLNDRGQCVLDGDFSRSRQDFYFSVAEGPTGRPYFVRFSREGLAIESRK